jgi:ribosomal protein S17E
MRRSLSLVVCLVLTLAGCKAKELADKASISKDLQKRGTTDLMQEIAKDSYDAPTDGRLKDSQIQMYLKVREHEKQIAQVAKDEMKQHAQQADKSKNSLAGMIQGMKALGSAADFVTADLRAAKDLGYNTQEYIWVKQQILAVSTTAMAEKFNDAMKTNFDKAYTEAKKAYDEAKDEQTKKLYADVLAGYDKSKTELQQSVQQDPAIAFNRQLLTKYENVLSAYANELEKYADKPGEVQKSMQELDKKLEEAKKK